MADRPTRNPNRPDRRLIWDGLVNDRPAIGRWQRLDRNDGRRPNLPEVTR